MALPIKETPILTGKDARRFDKILHENLSKKVPMADYLRAEKVFREIKMLAPVSLAS